MAPYVAGIPDAILHLQHNEGVTQNSYNMLDLTTGLQDLSNYCTPFHDISVDAPVLELAKVAQNVSVACTDLVSVDQADLAASNSKWTSKLASDDQHWLEILKERLVVLKGWARN